MTELKHILKEIEFRQNYVGEGFLKPPKGNFQRINLFGEISHCEDFIEDNLYLTYEVCLPLGWKVDNENEYYVLYKADIPEDENINKLKSVSQISSAYTGSISDLPTNFHNFSFPFDLELLCHDGVFESEWPKLLIQVNSVDRYKRHKIEGYTFTTVPNSNGFHQFELSCFRPIEDNFMKIYSFFLGGSRKIVDLSTLAKTSSISEDNVQVALNRYGIQSEFSGKVFVNMNIAIQSLEFSLSEKKNVQKKTGKDTFNLFNHIEEQINIEENNLEFSNVGEMMNTKNFGGINRHEGH